MDTVGEQLRSARLAKNLKIEDVVKKTKIRGHFIRCMEDQELGELPSEFAAQSFLRQYALLLELDAEQLVRDASLSVPSLDEHPEIVAALGYETPSLFFVQKAVRETRAAIRRRTAPIGKAVIALGLIVTCSTLWFYSTNTGDGGRQTASSAGSPATRASPPLEAAASKSGTRNSRGTGPQASPTLASIPGSSSPLELEIQAIDRVWIRWLIDGDDEGQATLNSQERKRIRADDLVQVTIGNAGAVNLVVNGAPQAPVGLPDEVRHLEITREGLTRIPPGTF